MNTLFSSFFDSSSFPARWYCGTWSPLQGWLLILSDIAIFAAYAAIPATIVFFVMTRRHELVFSHLYWLFAIFILSCGLTHLIDAFIFWQPMYGMLGAVKLVTAISSWATVILLVRIVPKALGLPGTVRLNRALQLEVEQHKRATEALRESSTRLNLAVQHSRLGDFRWDAETKAITLSTRAAEIYGVLPEVPHLRDELLQLLHPDDRERSTGEFRRAILDHVDYDIEYRVIRPNDGQQIWVNARGRGDYAEDGRVIALLGVVQDITDRKGIEQEREQLLMSEQAARADAEHASRMKDEFLANLSHELRTPLNAISGWTHLLKTETDEQERQEGLKVIEQNARVQTQLIEDLLDMNRIITGQIRLDVQMVDLQRVVNAALDGVRPSADSREIQITAVLDRQSTQVLGDPARLQQVVWNLLTNAIKFTPRGGQVKVELQQQDAGVEIAIADTGVGIPTGFLPYIFERFRQADATTTRRHGGLGLGLAIVKNLVELHGGTIVGESKGEGCGSTFRLHLPLPAMRSTSTSSPRTASASSPAAGPSTAPSLGDAIADLAMVRLLLVDDEPDSLTMLRRMLARRGAIIETASNGLDALKKFHEHHYHAIISDIGMPELDGFELLRRVRSSPTKANVPAIALTAYARADDRQRALEAGFNEVLFKPVEPVDLLTALARCLPRR